MQLDISNLAYIAGEVLGIGEFAGGIFCVFMVYVVSLAVLSILMKDVKNSVVLLDGVFSASLGLALGWVDLWLPSLAVLIVIFIIVVKGLGGLDE